MSHLSLVDELGVVGGLIMMVAFALLQFEKISAKNLSYPLMNLIGASLVIVSLWFRFNLAAFMLECFWIAISLYGVVNILRQRRLP